MNYNNFKQNKPKHTLRNFLPKHRRQHDPLLVLNMSIFNLESGWSRILNAIKARENN